MIFPFPVFQLWFVCCIRIFFHSLALCVSLFSPWKKATNELMWWNRGFTAALFFRSSHFQIIFYCFCNFVFMPFHSWFSRVCLNHSLLTYKVCLNKHVPRFYSLSPSVGEGCVSMHVCVFIPHFSIFMCNIVFYASIDGFQASNKPFPK